MTTNSIQWDCGFTMEPEVSKLNKSTSREWIGLRVDGSDCETHRYVFLLSQLGKLSAALIRIMHCFPDRGLGHV